LKKKRQSLFQKGNIAYNHGESGGEEDVKHMFDSKVHALSIIPNHLHYCLFLCPRKGSKAYIQRSVNRYIRRDNCISMFIVVLFTITKPWNQLRSPTIIHNTMLLSHKEKWNYVICWEMDRTGEHDVEWDKPSSKSQVSHVFTHLWILDLKWW
jgi:hypothetical protein